LYPSPFAYEAPSRVSDAVELLAGDEDAKALAGGQSLIPMMKLRFARPSILVDLRRIEELHLVAVSDGELRIGAMVTESVLAGGAGPFAAVPILQDTARVIADPLVRNSATLGGNLAHGDAENDQPATMLAVGASFSVVGPAGERNVAAADFFHGLYDTDLGPADILTGIKIPLPRPGTGSAYVKLRRQVGDFAIVAAAVSITAARGSVDTARIALTGLGPVPVRATEAEEALVGKSLRDPTYLATAKTCADTVELRDDSPTGYLSSALTAIVYRALRKAGERAELAA
jgi:carbon-monoxide dehydrogenase medium subunit